MVFFARKQAHNVRVMRAPRQYVDCQNKHIQAYQVRVEYTNPIPIKEDTHLDNAKHRHSKKRAERAPFRKEDEEHNSPQKRENDEDKPQIFARKRKPKQAERRGNPLAALELACDGEDVPDNDEQAAKITDKIGNKYFRAHKRRLAIKEEANKRGNAALERVAQEGDEADF